jgi:hypothetical protein
MNIYAFYEKIDNEIDAEYQKIIEIWKNSWRSNGWNPIILTLEDSKKHPDFQNFYNIINKYSSIHQKQYIDMCYLRWLAIANLGGWYTDIDMINFGFKPVDYIDQIVSCSHCVCPSTIYMTKEKYQKYIVESLKFYDFNDKDVYDSQPNNKSKIKNTSDMLILHNKKIYEKIDIKLNNQCDYDIHHKWNNYSIIHFHSACFNANKMKRHEIILEYGKTNHFKN